MFHKHLRKKKTTTKSNSKAQLDASVREREKKAIRKKMITKISQDLRHRNKGECIWKVEETFTLLKN